MLRYEDYEPILPSSLLFSTLLLLLLPPVLFDLPAADSLKLPSSLLLDPPYSPPIYAMPSSEVSDVVGASKNRKWILPQPEDCINGGSV